MQERAYSSHQLWWWIWLTIAISAVLGMACYCAAWKVMFPAETRAPETFPTAEIVYKSAHGVGFVNADGSNPEYVEIVINEYGNKSEFWRPVITSDNHTLIIKVAPSHFHVYNPHTLAVWRSGEFPVLCSQWQEQTRALLSADQAHIFIRIEQGIALYNLNSCGTDALPIKVYENVFGVPSPNLQYIAYTNRSGPSPGDDRFIVIREMSTGIERTIGIGDYPAWSRDSHWIAYTGTDGIYIYNVLEKLEPRRVILYPNLFDKRDRTYTARDYWEIPPEVSWSPDGKWLVYHKWTGTDYHTGIYPSDNAIYKLNLETGEEIKVIDGGMYPYWRWPAEQPGE